MVQRVAAELLLRYCHLNHFPFFALSLLQMVNALKQLLENADAIQEKIVQVQKEGNTGLRNASSSFLKFKVVD